MAETTKFRMLNTARVDAMFSPPELKKWHYPANLSILCEENGNAKEKLLSHLIAYSYLPTLTTKERAELRLKIYTWNRNIENADEDEMLTMLIKLKEMAKSTKTPTDISTLFMTVPMGMHLESGKFALYSDYPIYLAGPSPVFEDLLNNMDYDLAAYELRALLELKPEYIKCAYDRQEKTLINFLGEWHYSTLFPYLLLANRQGRYVFHTGYGTLETTNFKISPSLIQRGKKSIVVGVGEIFASKRHARWFVNSFVKENMLHEACYTLEELFKPVKQSKLAVVFFEGGVELAYIENSDRIHLLMPDGLRRL